MKIDVSTPSISKNITGFNCEGLMMNTNWDDSAEVNKLVQFTEELHPATLRVFDGGGYQFLHIMQDENGEKSVGLGYRLSEILSAFDKKEIDAETRDIYLRKIQKQETVNYRAIDQFVFFYRLLSYKPRVLYVMNWKRSTVAEELAAVDMLIRNGVEVYGIELGNEVYAKEEFGDYIIRCAPFALAVAQKHSNVKIGIPVPATGRNQKWNKALTSWLKNATFPVHAVIPHIYSRVSGQIQADYNSQYLAANPNFDITGNEFLVNLCNRQIYDNIVNSAYNASILKDLELTFVGKELWATEWGIAPSSPFGNTFVDAQNIIEMTPALLECKMLTVACHQTYYAPDFHGTMVPRNERESELLESPVLRAKAYALIALSKVYGYNFLRSVFMNNDVKLLAYVKELAGPDSSSEDAKMIPSYRVAIVASNTSDTPVVPQFDFGHPVLFLSSYTYGYGSNFGGVGLFDFMKDNKFYKKNPDNRRVEISASDKPEGHTIAPHSVTVLFYELITMKPVDETPVHSADANTPVESEGAAPDKEIEIPTRAESAVVVDENPVVENPIITSDPGDEHEENPVIEEISATEIVEEVSQPINETPIVDTPTSEIPVVDHEEEFHNANTDTPVVNPVVEEPPIVDSVKDNGASVFNPFEGDLTDLQRKYIRLGLIAESVIEHNLSALDIFFDIKK